MSNEGGAEIIQMETPETDAMFASTKRAMRITPAINRLTFDDADEIRALFSDLTGRKVDDRFRLIPPSYTAYGIEIRVGRHVFINKNRTLYDLAFIGFMLLWAWLDDGTL
jgi:hypothetical protein